MGVVKALRRINQRLLEQDRAWNDKWLEMIPYNIQKTSLNDWFIGRASIPLVALEKLNQFDCGKDLEKIYANLEYVASTTRVIVKIPNELSPDILYLAGLILGDGCLPIVNRKVRIINVIVCW